MTSTPSPPTFSCLQAQQSLERVLAQSEEVVAAPAPQRQVHNGEDRRTDTTVPAFQTMLVVGPNQMPRKPELRDDGTYECERRVRQTAHGDVVCATTGQPVAVDETMQVYPIPDVDSMSLSTLEQQTFRRFMCTVPQQHTKRMKLLRRRIGDRYARQFQTARRDADRLHCTQLKKHNSLLTRQLTALIAAVRDAGLPSSYHL